MGLEQRMGQTQQQTVEQKQRLEQRKILRQELALRLSLNLQAPPPFESKRGLEGLCIADKILKDNNEAGVLIGGLAKVVWERTRDEEAFNHKDVDVLVLPKKDEPCKIIYGQGIDWWLPKTTKIDYKDLYASHEGIDILYFKNMNDVVLYFKPEDIVKAAPGLHILELEQFINMRYSESTSALRVPSDREGPIDEYSEFMIRNHQKVPSKHLPEEYRNSLVPLLKFEPIDQYAYTALTRKIADDTQDPK